MGRHYSAALAREGAKVAILDVSECDAAADAINYALGRRVCLGLSADVSDEVSVRSSIASVLEWTGRIDVLVNNAALYSALPPVTFADIDVEAWDNVMAVNLRGPFLMVKHAAPAMIERKYGKIINVASMSGYIVNRPQKAPVYNISKAGVLHLTKCLATEWASLGIRVNSISPGYTLTQQLEINLTTPEGQAKVPQWLSHTPMGRFAKLSDLQGAVVFLASPVSDFVTGADILIDGGYTAW